MFQSLIRGAGHAAGANHIERWSIPAAVLLILFGGLGAAYLRGQAADAEMRRHLLGQAMAVARTVDPARVRPLSFTLADSDLPEFQRLGHQMAAYARAMGLRAIYTMALQAGEMVFGPESLVMDDLLATPPGTAYTAPPVAVHAVFQDRLPRTAGPYRDEFGAFVSAYAPVVDPYSGLVLTVIGVDQEAGDWQAQIWRMRLIPLVFALALVAALLVGDSLVRRRNRLPEEGRKRLRYVEAWSVAALGLALTAAVALLLHEDEIRARRTIFSQLAYAQERHVAEALRQIQDHHLAGLVHFFAGSDHVTRQEFRTYVGPLVGDGAAQAYGWVPHVLAADKDEVEAAARRDGPAAFTVFEQDPQGHTRSAVGRDAYFPLFYVEPLASHRPALGFDLGSDPVRRTALEEAARTGLPTATDVLTSLREFGIEPGILVFYPFFTVDAPTATGDDGLVAADDSPARAATLSGWALAILDLVSTLNAALAEPGQEDETVYVDLVQLHVGEPAQWVAGSSPEHTASHVSVSALLANGAEGLNAVYPLFVFGKAYAIVVHPGPAFLAANPIRSGWMAGGVGLLLTALLVAFILVQSRGRQELERQVQARTAALRKSENLLQKVFETLPVGLWLADANGKLLRSNAAGRDIWGAEPLVGPEESGAFKARRLPSQEEIAPDDWALAHTINEGVTVVDELLEIDTFDGRKRIILNYTAPVLDSDGQVEAAIIVNQDITERQQLWSQVQAQAEQMAQIMHSVPEGVLLLDPDGRVLLANPRGEEDLRRLATAGVGDTLAALGDRFLPELLVSPAPGGWHEVRTGGRIFEAIARPVEAGPTPAGWVLVLRDVTVERTVQQQLQRQERLAAIGQLAAGIAHDFNNILAVIVLYAQIMAQSPRLTERERGQLATIDQQAQHAAQMIQQILDFSRQAVLERRSLDLLPLLQEAVKLLQRTLPEHVEIDLTCEPGEYWVQADATRLQQVVMNLTVNARDAMAEGGTLRLGLARERVETGRPHSFARLARGEWIRLTVEDTGTGMEPEVLEHIFEPFFTTKAPGAGVGLGLAQVHGIVGQHGGEIGVASQVGAGTTFTIYLPAQPAPGTSLGVADVTQYPLGNGQVVLVVEDDPVVRAALVDLLGSWQYRTLTAANGVEALALLSQAKEPVDLVLSDVVMPRMGGKALFHALREQGRTVPMILLTGHPRDADMEKLLASGLSAWLPKPPSLDQLARAMAYAVGRERLG